MTYGKDGILKENPKDILIKTAYTHDIDGSELLKFGLHKADQAWALALYKAGVIPNDKIKILLQGLLDLEKQDFILNPEFGDIYNSKSVALQNIIGDVEGYIHTGRPRREAINIGYLISLKIEIEKLYLVLIDLSKTFLALSKKFSDAIMPDLTYLHHAQPTVFGHYVLTFLFPLFRDMEKLQLAYKHINSSPSGSGSVNGTSIPIDREYLKKLLSFSLITLHTRDAMWQVDTPIEVISILSSIMTNLNRLSDELQIFNTQEFSLIKLPDSLCRASVIMPQKQNPYPLTYFRGVASEILGKSASYSAYGKIPSGNPDSRTFVYVDILKSIKKVTGAISLLNVTLQDISFNREVAYERVKNSFLYATDIAEWLTIHKNIPYKEAHKVVGAVIRDMQEKNIKPSDIKSEFFEKYINVPLDTKTLKKLIEPKNIVKSRTSLGGANDLENIWDEISEKINNFISNYDIMETNMNYLKSEINYVMED